MFVAAPKGPFAFGPNVAARIAVRHLREGKYGQCTLRKACINILEFAVGIRSPSELASRSAYQLQVFHLMIIFDLCCSHAHRFEGWFASPADFDAQAASGLVTCPVCGDPAVRRVPSVVHLASSLPPPTVAPAAGKSDAVAVQPVQPAAVLRQLVNALLATSDDVGRRFAEEARRMHYHEAPARSIRGQASQEEFEALQEEGIEVLRVPVIGKEDLS